MAAEEHKSIYVIACALRMHEDEVRRIINKTLKLKYTPIKAPKTKRTPANDAKVLELARQGVDPIDICQQVPSYSIPVIRTMLINAGITKQKRTKKQLAERRQNMRRMYDEGATSAQLSSKFGMSEQVICKVLGIEYVRVKAQRKVNTESPDP
jgi:Mor family transcriptional regulator